MLFRSAGVVVAVVQVRGTLPGKGEKSTGSDEF